MRPGLVILGVAAMAACDKAPSSHEPGGPIRTDDSATIAPHQAGTLPRRGAGPRFVGKWAADQKSCQSAAWQFTDTTLKSPDGSSCSFNRMTEVPGGYDVQATCTAKGAPSSDLLKIRFAESAKAMLLSSNVIAETGLVFCGRDV